MLMLSTMTMKSLKWWWLS